MVDLDVIKKLAEKTESKIVQLVLDGLGGTPDPNTGMTELETARTPNLDRLATEGICGLSDPVSPGITPGSGPGHLSLFGYDPVKYQKRMSQDYYAIYEAVGIDRTLNRVSDWMPQVTEP